MRIPYALIKTGSLCTALVILATLTGCVTKKDQEWIQQRAAQLVDKTNPGTGKPYTKDEALAAARDENTFAARSSAGLLGGSEIAQGIKPYEPGYWAGRFNPPLPPSMQAYPSPQPTMSCFVAGTPVHTPAGTRDIEDIRIGDVVLSFNERLGKVEPSRVTKIITGRRSDLVVVRSRNGEVTCSQNHRFLTDGNGWREASALSAADRAISLGPDAACVLSIKFVATHKELKSPVAVHNFEVEGNHDYFVGPDAILCHNSKGGM